MYACNESRSPGVSERQRGLTNSKEMQRGEKEGYRGNVFNTVYVYLYETNKTKLFYKSGCDF